MPKVQVWQCPHTKQLFPLEEESKYKAHLARLSRNRAAEKKALIEKDAYWRWFTKSTADLNTPQKIGNWVNDNFRKIYKHYHGSITKGARLKGIEIGGSYSPECSNSHSAPRGKETNWGGRKTEDGVPRGYPGIRGRIKIHNSSCPFSHNPFSSVTRVLERIGVNTGTGGGGGKVSVYDVTLWLDDWPGLKAEVERQLLEHEEETVIATLKGERPKSFSVVWPDTNEIPDWDRNK